MRVFRRVMEVGGRIEEGGSIKVCLNASSHDSFITLAGRCCTVAELNMID